MSDSTRSSDAFFVGDAIGLSNAAYREYKTKRYNEAHPVKTPTKSSAAGTAGYASSSSTPAPLAPTPSPAPFTIPRKPVGGKQTEKKAVNLNKPLPPLIMDGEAAFAPAANNIHPDILAVLQNNNPEYHCSSEPSSQSGSNSSSSIATPPRNWKGKQPEKKAFAHSGNVAAYEALTGDRVPDDERPSMSTQGTLSPPFDPQRILDKYARRNAGNANRKPVAGGLSLYPSTAKARIPERPRRPSQTQVSAEDIKTRYAERTRYAETRYAERSRPAPEREHALNIQTNIPGIWSETDPTHPSYKSSHARTPTSAAASSAATSATSTAPPPLKRTNSFRKLVRTVSGRALAVLHKASETIKRTGSRSGSNTFDHSSSPSPSPASAAPTTPLSFAPSATTKPRNILDNPLAEKAFFDFQDYKRRFPPLEFPVNTETRFCGVECSNAVELAELCAAYGHAWTRSRRPAGRMTRHIREARDAVSEAVKRPKSPDEMTGVGFGGVAPAGMMDPCESCGRSGLLLTKGQCQHCAPLPQHEQVVPHSESVSTENVVTKPMPTSHQYEISTPSSTNEPEIQPRIPGLTSSVYSRPISSSFTNSSFSSSDSPFSDDDHHARTPPSALAARIAADRAAEGLRAPPQASSVYSRNTSSVSKMRSPAQVSSVYSRNISSVSKEVSQPKVGDVVDDPDGSGALYRVVEISDCDCDGVDHDHGHDHSGREGLSERQSRSEKMISSSNSRSKHRGRDQNLTPLMEDSTSEFVPGTARSNASGAQGRAKTDREIIDEALEEIRARRTADPAAYADAGISQGPTVSSSPSTSTQTSRTTTTPLLSDSSPPSTISTPSPQLLERRGTCHRPPAPVAEPRKRRDPRSPPLGESVKFLRERSEVGSCLGSDVSDAWSGVSELR